jgi:hypothetical protein
VNGLESIKPPECPGQLNYFERTLRDLAPVDVTERERVAFELIEPGDPMLNTFIEDTYRALYDARGLPKDNYAMLLAFSIFSHAQYLAEAFPDCRENQTLRLKAWVENIWVFIDCDHVFPEYKVEEYLNSLCNIWTENYGMELPGVGYSFNAFPSTDSAYIL